MSNGREVEKPCHYQIRVKGNFTPEWSIWFEGFTISHGANGETRLKGQILDQAALHGLLARIARMGISLLEITRQEDAGPTSVQTIRLEEQWP